MSRTNHKELCVAAVPLGRRLLMFNRGAMAHIRDDWSDPFDRVHLRGKGSLRDVHTVLQ